MLNHMEDFIEVYKTKIERLIMFLCFIKNDSKVTSLVTCDLKRLKSAFSFAASYSFCYILSRIILINMT